MKSIKEIRKIVKFCKQNGIYHYKDDGLEFQLSRKALCIAKIEDDVVAVPIAGIPSSPTMDPMDLLLWSSTPAQFEEPNA